MSKRIDELLEQPPASQRHGWTTLQTAGQVVEWLERAAQDVFAGCEVRLWERLAIDQPSKVGIAALARPEMPEDVVQDIARRCAEAKVRSAALGRLDQKALVHLARSSGPQVTTAVLAELSNRAEMSSSS